jgi:hypothetical protein
MTRIDWLAAIQKGFAAGKNAEHAENAGSTGFTPAIRLKSTICKILRTEPPNFR